jgi:hypothetical protein
MDMLLLKHAIHEGQRGFDFLRGDEAYKASWWAEPYDLVELRAAGRSARARLRHAGWWIADAGKRCLRYAGLRRRTA